MAEKKILLAEIGAAHGIKGEVRVKPFGEPDMLDRYGKLETADGRKFRIKRMRPQKHMLVVKFEGVNTRDEAEALTGLGLFVDREKLPPPDDNEFYISDLIGMQAINRNGSVIGEIVEVPNFGADDMLEIRPDKGASFYLPLTSQTVPEIDFESGLITIIPPPEVSGREGGENEK
jgi:16S rRNA processing protein RimM